LFALLCFVLLLLLLLLIVVVAGTGSNYIVQRSILRILFASVRPSFARTAQQFVLFLVPYFIIIICWRMEGEGDIRGVRRVYEVFFFFSFFCLTRQRRRRQQLQQQQQQHHDLHSHLSLLLSHNISIVFFEGITRSSSTIQCNLLVFAFGFLFLIIFKWRLLEYWLLEAASSVRRITLLYIHT
jgi:hypothetical protein